MSKFTDYIDGFADTTSTLAKDELMIECRRGNARSNCLGDASFDEWMKDGRWAGQLLVGYQRSGVAFLAETPRLRRGGGCYEGKSCKEKSD